MMQEIIKEYLVSLNLKVNKSQFTEFTGKIKELENLTSKLTSNTARNVTAASVAVVGFLASVTGGVAAFLDGLADSDIETEKFARRMWMTEESARSLQMVLTAMNSDMSDIEDIAMNSELRGYFFALKKEAAGLMPPAEWQERLQKIREIKFEFMRLRLIISYGAQWVGFYLTKYLGEPMTKIKVGMHEINDYLESHMSTIADKIAKVLSKIVMTFYYMVEAISKVTKAVKGFFDSLSPKQKNSAGAILGVSGIGILIKLISLANPLMRVIGIISMLIGLFSDFTNYSKNGGNSPLKWLYDPIIEVFGDKELGVAFEDTLKSILDVVGEFAAIWDELNSMWKDATGKDITTSFLYTVKDTLVTTLQIVKNIMDFIAIVLEYINKALKKLRELYDLANKFKHPLTNGEDKNTNGASVANVVGPTTVAGGALSTVLPTVSGPMNIYKLLTWMKEVGIPTMQADANTPTKPKTGLANTSAKAFNGTLNATYNIYGGTPEKIAKETDKGNRLILNQVTSTLFQN